MKTTITEHDFIEAFHNCDRFDHFGYDGLKALFEWLEELEVGTDTEMELDVIALCCDFTLYDNLKQFQTEYNADDYPDIESIQDATCVIMVDDDAFIIQAF